MLSGCATNAPRYTPKTRAGIEQKIICTTNLSHCQANAFNCERAYADCIESVMQIDALEGK